MLRRILTAAIAASAMWMGFAPVSAAEQQPAPEGRGCCSHHDGVCGCAGGRVQCCDGTTSPSCRC